MLNRILFASLVGALVVGCSASDGGSNKDRGSVGGAGGDTSGGASGNQIADDGGVVGIDSGTGGSGGSAGGEVGGGGADPGGNGGTDPGEDSGANPGGSGGTGGNATDPGIHFVAYGDSRTNQDDHQTILDAFAKLNPELVLNTGDLWDGYGASAWKSAVTKNPGIADLLDNNLFLVSRGNHESVSELLNFSPTIVRENDEKYSFTVGNTFFISLGYATANGASFLQQRLQTPEATSATWRVVFSHVPVYSGGNHGADGIPSIEAVCDTFDVNLFFNGHDHIYERSHQMYGEQISDDGNDLSAGAGTVYIVAGGGGAPLYSASTISSTHTSASALHFVEVTTSATTLTAKATKPDGTVFDTFTLTR